MSGNDSASTGKKGQRLGPPIVATCSLDRRKCLRQMREFHCGHAQTQCKRVGELGDDECRSVGSTFHYIVALCDLHVRFLPLLEGESILVLAGASVLRTLNGEMHMGNRIHQFSVASANARSPTCDSVAPVIRER